MAKKKPCTRCGRELAQVNYYKSYSEININADRLSICKDCLNDIYELYYNEFEDDMKATYKVCIKTDTYFDMKLFETSKEKYQESNMSLINYYFSKVGLSQYKGKTFTDGDFINIWDKKVIKSKPKVDENKITNEMVNKWGKGYTVEDYMYLEDRYKELIAVYDHRMPTQKWIYESIVKTKLECEKALKREDYVLYDKLTDRVQKLFTDANIKPIQMDDDQDSDTNLIGYWVKLIQEEEPIPEAVGKFADADGIQTLFDNQFVKTMRKVLGVGE